MKDADKIRKYLKTHRYVTVMECIHKLGVYNPRSRISEMVDVVKDGMVEVVRDDGVLTRVARYTAI